MSDDQRWTDKIDNEILEWVLNNSDSIETKTPFWRVVISPFFAGP